MRFKSFSITENGGSSESSENEAEIYFQIFNYFGNWYQRRLVIRVKIYPRIFNIWVLFLHLACEYRAVVNRSP